MAVNIKRGLRRVLVVLAAIYWLTAATTTFLAYGSAAGAVRVEAATKALEATDAEAVADAQAGANEAAAAASRGVPYVPKAAPGNIYRVRTPGGHVLTVMAPDLKAAARVAGAWTATQRDLDSRAASAGWHAAGETMLAWTACFLALTYVSLIVRWVWRGFAESRRRRPEGAAEAAPAGSQGVPAPRLVLNDA